MANQAHFCLVIFCGLLSTLVSSQTIPKMMVQADIRFRFATTEIKCFMTNDKDTASELTFDMTLPKEAFIANFSMEIEGKSYPGDVKKKQEARKEYLAARRTGSFGGLVEQSARHSNKFDVSVNIAAGSSVTFTLIYQELLRRHQGSYEYMVYIDNATLADIQDFSVEVYIQDRNAIHDVRTPAMRKEVMSNHLEEDQNILTEISSPSENAVSVVYKPSREALKQQGPGWFVVQYDVDSESAGELMVVDGYFVHFFTPPDDLPPLPLDIVFVLDISGSMAGRKLIQLKNAMRIILGDLRETDRFNILLFDSSVSLWETTLQEASPSNLERARSFVAQINFRGSTDLHQALMRGLRVLQGSREASRVPMMFFLTDGEPTAGVQNSAQIVSSVSKQNEGVVNIYSLAFGGGADYKLLRQISANNNGFARKIYEASDAAQQVTGLYREISTIVMRNLSITYHPTSNNDDGSSVIRPPVIIDNETVTICDLSVLYGNSDFVVAGKLKNSEILDSAPENAGGLKLEVSGLGAMTQINFVLEENDLTKLILEGQNPFWSVPRDLSKMAERAWAFLKIKELLKKKVAAVEDSDLVESLDAQILELSLKYHFVTPLTSMVVTRPEDGLKKDQKKEASFTADDDVPAAKMDQIAYSSQHRPSQVMSMTPGLLRGGRYPGLHASYSPVGVKRVASAPSGSMRRRLSHPPPASAHKGFADVYADYDDMLLVDPHPVAMTAPPPPTHVYTSSRPRTTTTTTTTRKPKKIGRKKGKKGKKNKNKKCIRNRRVFLRSVVMHGSQTPIGCYEIKATRSKGNKYNLFSDPTANVKVFVAMERKFLKGLVIDKGGEAIKVNVTAKGELASSVPMDLQDGAIKMTQGSVVITVNVTKTTCKASFVTININVGQGDTDPAVVRQYRGIVAKAIQKSGPLSRRKGKGKKKKKVPKGCVDSKAPADRSVVAKGKYLLRFKV